MYLSMIRNDSKHSIVLRVRDGTNSNTIYEREDGYDRIYQSGIQNNPSLD